jgi:RHS repeat-associated protein
MTPWTGLRRSRRDTTYGTNIVSQTRNVSTTPATSYYGFDAHGNVAFLTDAAGAVTDSYDYDAWGNLVASTGSTPNSRLYAGEELDPDIGVMNLRARQYRPTTGRFLTIDPLMGNMRKPTSLNRYLYTSVDPVNFSDPSGRVEVMEMLGNLALSSTIVNGALLGVTIGIANKAEDPLLKNAAWNYFQWGAIEAVVMPLLPVGGADALGGTLACMYQLSIFDQVFDPDTPVPDACKIRSPPDR